MLELQVKLVKIAMKSQLDETMIQDSQANTARVIKEHYSLTWKLS